MLDLGVTCSSSEAPAKSKEAPKAKEKSAKSAKPKTVEKKTKAKEKENRDEEEDPMAVFESIEHATEGGKKRLSIERIYQKKTQLEHILLRPDTYIGSTEPHTERMWVYDRGDADADAGAGGQMSFREISYVPGLYKIFDEILVNAADNKQRDRRGMNAIKINVDRSATAVRHRGSRSECAKNLFDSF